MSRIITVFNATGTQGSSVIAGILSDGTFVPRAITRNASSSAAQKLAAQGVQVVEADVRHPETLARAVEGSECVFAVTYDPTGPDALNEFEQGKRIVEASKAAGVKFVLWSSLPSANKLSGGKYNLPPYDDKARVDDVLIATGLPHAKIYTGWFASNLWKHQMLCRHPKTGEYQIAVPYLDLTIPQLLSWVERDMGPATVAIYKNYNVRPELVLNQTFVLATERMTFYKWAEIASKAIGEPVSPSSEEIEQLSDFKDMIYFINEFKPDSDAKVPDPKLLELGMPNMGGLDDEYIRQLKEHFTK